MRAAKNFVADVGEAAASASTGLIDLASRSEENAERDCHRLLVNRYKLALPIPVSRLDTGDDLRVPVLKLRDWAEYIVRSNSTHILCGLEVPDWQRESAILDSFWNNYRQQCPKHPVFEKARLGELQLKHCFPMVLHGDEGRGRRRQAFLVMNFHSVLGRGLRKKSKKKKAPYIQLSPNYHGHTLTSRFLMCGLPKERYTGKNEHVFEDLLSLAAEESQYMFSTGILDPHGRGRFFMAVLYVSGDWPWLADSGHLQRSFRNVQKHKTRKNPPGGICHLCKGGQPGFDFEEINTDRPKWLQSMFSQDIWNEFDGPSPLENIPHVPGQVAGLWMYDIFHTWHLGIARSLLGSFIALMADCEDSGSVEGRFESLSLRYSSWCKSNKKRQFVRSLTKELIGWLTTTTYPNGGWHKGALSTTLSQWAESRYRAEGANWNPMMQLAGQATISGNCFLRALYSAEAFLSSREAEAAASHGLKFLKAYSRLAVMAHDQNRMLWVIQPKIHAYHHLVLHLLDASHRGCCIINPLCYATQADEDFIGRPSRLSRRVTGQPVGADRVLERYLQSSYTQWVKAGYIRMPKSFQPGTTK